MALNHPARTARFVTPVQKAALAVGAVFLLVGTLRFMPGVTSDYDPMTLAGHAERRA